MIMKTNSSSIYLLRKHHKGGDAIRFYWDRRGKHLAFSLPLSEGLPYLSGKEDKITHKGKSYAISFLPREKIRREFGETTVDVYPYRGVVEISCGGRTRTLAIDADALFSAPVDGEKKRIFVGAALRPEIEAWLGRRAYRKEIGRGWVLGHCYADPQDFGSELIHEIDEDGNSLVLRASLCSRVLLKDLLDVLGIEKGTLRDLEAQVLSGVAKSSRLSVEESESAPTLVMKGRTGEVRGRWCFPAHETCSFLEGLVSEGAAEFTGEMGARSRTPLPNKKRWRANVTLVVRSVDHLAENLYSAVGIEKPGLGRQEIWTITHDYEAQDAHEFGRDHDTLHALMIRDLQKARDEAAKTGDLIPTEAFVEDIQYEEISD